MKENNYIRLEFPSRSSNESFARAAAAAFAAQLDPTMEELGDLRTAVSEAVTNAIVHAYPDSIGKISMRMRILDESSVEISAAAWALPSWAASRTGCGCAPSPAEAPPSPCASTSAPAPGEHERYAH